MDADMLSATLTYVTCVIGLFVVHALGRFWVERKYADPKIVARVDTQEAALKNALVETRAELHRLQSQIDQLKQKLLVDAQAPSVDPQIFNWRSQ